MALDSITKVLDMVQLDCIQVAQVTWIWHLSILATVCSSPESEEQRAETPSLPHSRSASEELQQEMVQFPPQFLSGTVSSLSVWTLPPCLNLPGPDAQVRVDRCLGNSEHNPGTSSTPGPLWLYPARCYHFTLEIKGEEQRQHTRDLWMGWFGSGEGGHGFFLRKGKLCQMTKKIGKWRGH